jgi:hypothetical protein
VTGRYTFSNNLAGRQVRADVVASCVSQGFDCREYEETVTAQGVTYTLLCLEVTGKRKDEGKIARAMKARKS